MTKRQQLRQYEFMRYYREGLNYHEIAVKANAGDGTVIKYLRNIPGYGPRKRGAKPGSPGNRHAATSPKRRELFVREYLRGKPIEQIVKERRSCERTVSRILKEHGLTVLTGPRRFVMQPKDIELAILAREGGESWDSIAEIVGRSRYVAARVRDAVVARRPDLVKFQRVGNPSFRWLFPHSEWREDDRFGGTAKKLDDWRLRNAS